MNLEGVFAEVPEPVRNQLAKAGRHRRFRAGETIFRAGTDAHGVWFVLAGAVRVTRGTHGRPHVVHEERAGGALGEAAVFGAGRYPATAVALTAVDLLFIDAPTLIQHMAADVRIALALMRRLAHRATQVIERLDALTGQPVLPRLSAWILARAPDAEGRVFTLGATQAALAEELGTVREVVVRNLRALIDQGLLGRAGRGAYRIMDHAALRRLASGAPD